MSAILIAEDEPRIAAFVSRGLEAAGYVTTVSDDGAEALDRALRPDVDLVLLDSAPGRGAAFTVVVPALLAPEELS